MGDDEDEYRKVQEWRLIYQQAVKDAAPCEVTQGTSNVGTRSDAGVAAETAW